MKQLSLNNGVTVLNDISTITRQREKTTIHILENLDTATITVGELDSDDNFIAYPLGNITEGNVVNHGINVRLAVEVSGVTSNPVLLGHSE